jgi:hypothetical protein
VVGVCERAGRIERIDGVVNVPQLLKETPAALQQFCVPVPGTPKENAFTVTPADAGRLLARGATAPFADVTIVTLYVRPDPRGPIGVRALPKGRRDRRDGRSLPVPGSNRRPNAALWIQRSCPCG